MGAPQMMLTSSFRPAHCALTFGLLMTAVCLVVAGCKSAPAKPTADACVMRPAAPVPATRPTTQVGWPEYASDKASTRYAPLSQIDAANFARLTVAWTWSPLGSIVCDDPWAFANEATPVLVDGVLYTSTAFSQVAAIHPVTGKTQWTFDPRAWRLNTPPNVGWVHRGVAYWGRGTDRRVFIGTGTAHLIALHAETGSPISDFGDNGRIDLTQGLDRPVPRRLYGVSSPPIVCGDVVVVGSSIQDFPEQAAMPPGDVRGFDVRTGALRWTFQTVARGGQLGSETWNGGAENITGGANPWAPLSCDEKLGLVYLPTGTAANDYYGGDRKGDNLFAESIVAVEVETGKRRWHFQGVHHGLWDYDFPAAPNLVDIVVDGRPIQALAQVSKQAFVYVLDRESGEPVWPMPEMPVPASDAPGERAAPTQPVPSRPAPFDYQGVSDDVLIDFTPALRRIALHMLKPYRYGALFTPPSLQGTVMLPGVVGGASWAGAAYHPGHHMLYVPSMTLPFTAQLRKSQLTHTPYVGTSWPQGGPEGLPLTKPPYSRITAIDLNTGDHRWVAPTGRGPIDHPALQNRSFGRLGNGRRSFVLATETLLFAVQEGPAPYGAHSGDPTEAPGGANNDPPALAAFDLLSGDLIGEVPLPGYATGAPMTYMVDHRQYIAVPIGGGDRPMQLVALRLP